MLSTRLVPEEVNLFEPFLGDVVQRVSLVPTCKPRITVISPTINFNSYIPEHIRLTGGEDVERDLTSDRVGKAEVGKLLFENLHKFGSAAALLVPRFKVVTFLGTEIGVR